MPHKDIEIILARQLASYLAMPIFIVDPEGNLIYYNEPAEHILGHRFEQTGEMSASEWSTTFLPTNDDGSVCPPNALPLVVALSEQRPSYRTFWINGLDNVKRHIEVAAFPLNSENGKRFGAVAIFWEVG